MQLSASPPPYVRICGKLFGTVIAALICTSFNYCEYDTCRRDNQVISDLLINAEVVHVNCKLIVFKAFVKFGYFAFY